MNGIGLLCLYRFFVLEIGLILPISIFLLYKFKQEGVLTLALFKIFKGNNTAKITNSSATGYITPTDGYAYYDTGSKLFYIDAAYSGTTISRQPINADNATNGIFYGTCTTAQATQAKVATLTNGTGFSLKAGTIVAIKFTYASAASTMTLNVNNTGAKNLYQYGTTLMSSGTTTTGWPAGAVIPFVYDGTYWFRLYWNNTDSNTLQRTYRSSTNVELPIAAISTANSSTAAYSAISSGGSKDVYAAIPNTDANRVMFNPSTGLMTFGQNGLKTSKIQAPTAAGGTTYGAGTSGQTLMTNGTTVYWGTPDLSSTYVKKSGDTMTGALVFNSSANNTYPYIKRTDIDSSVTSLSSAKYAMLTGVKDNNDNWIGYIENMISTTGENQLQIAARKSINGSNVNNALALKVAANGTKSATFESDVLPKTNNALNLGNSSYKWKDISATYLSGAFKQTLNLYAKDASDTAKSFVEIYARNYLGNISGQALYSVGNTTTITAGQWQFREYSPNSPASATSTGKYEQYSLPNATSGLSATQYYDILTTKLHFTNMTVATSAWTADTTYSGFSWKANIACNGVTANHVPNVIFDYNELISGNFCPFADSSSNTVTIYCKTKPTATITIPTIYCT